MGRQKFVLLFGKVIGEADVRDIKEMTASNAWTTYDDRGSRG